MFGKGQGLTGQARIENTGSQVTAFNVSGTLAQQSDEFVQFSPYSFELDVVSNLIKSYT